MQQSKLSQMEQDLELPGGVTSSAKIRGLENLKKRLAELRVVSQQIDSFNLSLGTVFATSGYRISASGQALDWGLIEINKDRTVSNKV